MPTASAQLHVITAGEENHREFRLTQATFSIGSDPDNSLVLEGASILPHHAEIVWQIDHYVLTLLGTHDTLRVNDKPLVSPEPLKLHPGDEIQMGDTAIHFRETFSTGVLASESALPGTVVSQTHCDRVLQVTTSKWTQDFPLNQETLTLGRHPQCDIVIDLPVVSDRHAQLNWENETYTIRDLDSLHGLIFAGDRIQEKALQDGDFSPLKIR